MPRWRCIYEMGVGTSTRHTSATSRVSTLNWDRTPAIKDVKLPRGLRARVRRFRFR